MARRPTASTRRSTVASHVLEPADGTLLDLLDRLLNKGVTLTGDVTLGVAGVDLIYLRLSSLLCAVDRVFPPKRFTSRRPRPRGLLARKGRS